MIQLNNGNKKILQIAIPSIVSNITVPLLGLIDVTIVGHLGSAAYIGAIAVGGMLFNIIYWIFGFLRMGTSGMTSQAYGRHDLNEVTRLLLRSVGVGLFIAFTLLALQYPIERTAFTFIQTTEEVEHLASLYFYICIWGAPAVLGLYSFAGWYIGMQNSRFPMYIAITQNIVNIAVSLLLVYGLGMKIEGVAIGTLTAQYAGLVMAYLLWLRYYSTLRKRIEWHSFFDKQAMYRFFQVNRDIFFRTICWWRLLSFSPRLVRHKEKWCWRSIHYLCNYSLYSPTLWTASHTPEKHWQEDISEPIIRKHSTRRFANYSAGE